MKFPGLPDSSLSLKSDWDYNWYCDLLAKLSKFAKTIFTQNGLGWKKLLFCEFAQFCQTITQQRENTVSTVNLDLRKPDLRKIVGTSNFLVHQLFDLRKIFFPKSGKNRDFLLILGQFLGFFHFFSTFGLIFHNSIYIS